jgi:UDP-glucose:(heptosyl)LPS alpha-1,3-glucosyltransferase
MKVSARPKPVKKIAVVIPKYGLVGGAERFAAELTERIALGGRFEMHVFANRWSPKSERVAFHKIPIIGFPKFLTTISFAHFAGQAISRLGMDVIHAHDRIFHADIFTMHGIPHRIWVERIRQKRWLSLFDRGTAWVEGRLIRNQHCRRILPVSTLTADVLREAYPDLEPARIDVMHPGVDAARYDHLDRGSCRREIRESYGIGMTDFLILFVSMNFDVKGLDQLIASLAKIKGKDQGNRVKLLIAGKGNRQKYLNLARDLGVGDQLVFTGVVKRDTLDKLYMAADIYAMLSQFDTFGMVVLEAMAASLPVIISGRVGAKDLVREGFNGYVIDNPADTDAITDRIIRFLDGEARHSMGQAAYETAKEHSWDAAAERMAAIYEKA